MFKIDTIQKKILLSIFALTATILLLTTTLFAWQSFAQVRLDITSKMQSDLAKDATQVSGFFTQYAMATRTYINTPSVVDWVINHTKRGSVDGLSSKYQPLNRAFHALSDNDENILSAFYASHHTKEYFAEDRVTGVAADKAATSGDGDYFVTQRPWYKKLLKNRYMLTTPPAVDIITGTISVSIEQLIERNGKVIGAGGIDISVNNIRALTEKIKFENQGFAALFDDNWNKVTFDERNLDVNSDKQLVKINESIANYDGVAGIEGLGQVPQQPPNTLVKVSINHQAYYALYQPVKPDITQMTWYLLLLVPESVVDEPAISKVFSQVISGVLFMVVILLILWLITDRVSKPLKLITHAFSDIAQGDSDLTKVIKVKSKDETGQLAGHFNQFLAKLRRVVTKVHDDKEQVQLACEQMDALIGRLSLQSGENKQSLDSVSAATTQLSASASEIENNATRTSKAANQMRTKTQSNVEAADNAQNRMDVLAEKIAHVNVLIHDLEDASSSIGQVIEVINTIASQTNLLALNAAIEAARAGEHGRGFSVVADEVRGLASRTQESTQEISAVIEQLQSKIAQACSGMDEGLEQTLSVKTNLAGSVESMSQMDGMIATIEEDMVFVASACVQQTKAINDISQVMHDAAQMADHGDSLMKHLGDNTVELQQCVSGLNKQLNQFSY